MWFESRFLQVHFFFFFALVSSSSLYLSLFTGSVLDSVLPGSHEKGIPSEFFCFVKEQVMEVIDLFLPPFQEILFTCLLITALDPIFQSDVASQPSKSPTLSSLEQVPTFLFSAALKGPVNIWFSPLSTLRLPAAGRYVAAQCPGWGSCLLWGSSAPMRP